MRPTHVEASAVNTVQWLTGDVTAVAIPVYQRHYRWEIAKCQTLLDDLRAVADPHDG